MRLSNAWRVLIVEQPDGPRVGILSFDDRLGDVEVSYVFHPDHWNRGFASEALRTVLSWMADRGTPTVIAVTQVSNARSLRLLDRLGFTEEARFVEYDEPQIQLRRVPDAGPDTGRS